MKRDRHEQHLAWIRSLHCCVCQDNTSVEPAHLRAADPRFAKPPTPMAQKPSDIWVTPLCSVCHRRQHAMGERHFWKLVGRDPWIIAAALWINTGDVNAAEELLRAQHGSVKQTKRPGC
jgi:hypothetical protein